MAHLDSLEISKEVLDHKGKEMALEHLIRSTELQVKVGQVHLDRPEVNQDLEMEMAYSLHMAHLIVDHHLDEGIMVSVLVLDSAKTPIALMDLLLRVLSHQVEIEVDHKGLRILHTALLMLAYKKGLLMARHLHRMALLVLEAQEDQEVAEIQVEEEVMVVVDPVLMEAKVM